MKNGEWRMENGEQFEFDAAEDLLLNVRAFASSC